MLASADSKTCTGNHFISFDIKPGSLTGARRTRRFRLSGERATTTAAAIDVSLVEPERLIHISHRYEPIGDRLTPVRKPSWEIRRKGNACLQHDNLSGLI